MPSETSGGASNGDAGTNTEASDADTTAAEEQAAPEGE